MGDTFRLRWVNREHGVLLFHVNAVVTVGRSDENAIVLDADGVSRRHCAIESVRGGLAVRDLGSTNGVYLNGAKVKEGLARAGDMLLIGRCQLEVCGDGESAEPARTQSLGTTTIELALRQGAVGYPESAQSAARAADHLKALCRVMDAINAHGASGTNESLLSAVLDAVLDALDFDYGAVVLGTDPSATPAASATRGAAASGSPLAPSRTVLDRVLAHGESVLANDVALERGLKDAKSIAGSAATRILAAPLVLGDRTVGALYFAALPGGRPVAESELRLVTVVARALGLASDNARRGERMRAETDALRATLAGDVEIVGSSRPLLEAVEVARRAARSPAPILIGGETGTGKELLAKAIHAWSDRARGPFLAINCGALTQTMIESELFGHEKGSFTGALERRIGKFELADKGTLFLDEIGDLSLDLQVKLLRALEEKRFFRIGGSREISVDVRVIAATNKDLREAIKTGRFREDLWYRIRVVEIVMPPLRNRKEDIPALAARLLARIAERAGRKPLALTPAAVTRLQDCAWPGNVRELRNVLERADLLSRSDRITVEDLALDRATPASTGTTGDGGATRLVSLAEIEKEHMRAVLRAVQFNKVRAAEILGIGRTSLYEKIKLYGIGEDAEE